MLGAMEEHLPHLTMHAAVARAIETVAPLTDLPGHAGFALDEDLRIVFAAGAELRARRVDPSTVIGHALADVVPTAQAAEAEILLRRALDGVAASDVAVVAGERYDVTAAPVSDRPGESPVGVLVLASRVDEPRGGQEPGRLASIVEATDDAIIGKTLDGRVTHWNPAAERLYGRTAEEMHGADVRTIIPRELWDQEDELLGRARAGETVRMVRTRRIHADGRQIEVDLSLSPVHDSTGRVVAISTISRDAEAAPVDERLAGLLESAPDAIIAVDAAGEILLANRRVRALLGYEPDDLVGRSVEMLVPARLHEIHRLHRAGYVRDPHQRPMGAGFDLRVVHQDGGEVPVEISLSPMQTTEGVIVAAVLRDASERRHQQRELRRVRSRFDAVFEYAPEGIALVSAALQSSGRFVAVNRALCDMCGLTEGELCQSSVWGLVAPEDREVLDVALRRAGGGRTDRQRHEIRLVRSDGTSFWVSVSASVVGGEDDEDDLFALHVSDISERKLFESRMEHLADHDHLTGLLNRRRLEGELRRVISLVERSRRAAAVVLLDLDRFKHVNDLHGHVVGDAVLRRLAGALATRLRESDVVSRLGGDEFAVIMPATARRDAEVAVEELLDLVRELRVDAPTGEVRVTASAGIVVVEPERPFDAEDVLLAADIAQQDAKEAGRDRWVVAEQERTKRQRLRARLTLSEHISQALENDGLVLFSQPVRNLATGEDDHAELLLRMRGADGELLGPRSFLYIAERFGLIRAIDRWVLGRALEIAERDPRRCYSVNVSGLTVSDPGTIAAYDALLAEAGACAQRLVFEITETAAVTNIEAARQFADLVGGYGCRLALDDFGSGFGSFYYLKHLPFDIVKIDGDFVRNVVSSAIDRLTVRAIVDIASGLGKQTVAEFVGDRATYEALGEYGIDYAQGYYVGPPAPLDV